MSEKTGVYPCYENQFQINTAASGITAAYKWTPFETEGWTRRLMTAKSVTVSVTAKRNVGDEGNDKISGFTFANGRDAEGDFKWTFPDSSSVEFKDAIISVTNNGSGDSTGVAPLEFEVMSNGKPTYTPAA